ncbi:UdgX family uracil-DNA binding protein [Bosea sp. 124]|uniref:UdgX family uracil-DNA binding protein n=1 Tax=Bosea sp. 124 TaxID=2135642 RepID=UPI000D416329|nr:UdgX family uracil-DNA binding protein [Bosea sp. 124]PTM42303.1 DNA polymerase [Bosea sp. 124]
MTVAVSTVLARLAHPADFEGWRQHARRLARASIAPADILWQVGDEPAGLFEGVAAETIERVSGRDLTVPRDFPELAQAVICHRDAGRFDLLFRLLLRLQREPALLRIVTDGDVHRAYAMAKSVRRDTHKMTAFVRFREIVGADGGEAFVAWFEPEHHIVERVSRFFVERFAAMRWSILTPLRSLHWDGATLHVGDGESRAEAPDDDAVEAYWRTYYANIFNPARLKIKAMKAEMPEKYWRNLPEAELIAPLIAGAGRRAEEMVTKAPTAPPERHRRQMQRMLREGLDEPLPPASWEQARTAAKDCARCGLCQHATQTVFGEGPLSAPVMFVGEQPGDQEDLAGRPFVGPAGRMFDSIMGEAGLDRHRAYVTNAVKHFKFAIRGKRRIHQKPNAGEVSACRFWLGLERDFVKPGLVVALGATALHALTGHSGSLAAMRDRDLTLDDGTRLVATVHPSYLLRLPDEVARQSETARFRADLERVGRLAPGIVAA